MEEEFFIHLISNIGIPAALCFYTLFGVNKNLKKLSGSIDRLANKIETRLHILEKDFTELKHKFDTRR